MGQVAGPPAVRLARLEVGIALYVKKLTYGFPSARVEELALADVSTPFLQQPGTRLDLTSVARWGTDVERGIDWPGLVNLPGAATPPDQALVSSLPLDVP